MTVAQCLLNARLVWGRSFVSLGFVSDSKFIFLKHLSIVINATSLLLECDNKIIQGFNFWNQYKILTTLRVARQTGDIRMIYGSAATIWLCMYIKLLSRQKVEL